MTMFLTIAAFAAVQAAQPAPVDHSQHSPAQHAQHQQGKAAGHSGEHKCCKEVNGKMECQMMKGHGGQHQGHGQQQGQSGHSH